MAFDVKWIQVWADSADLGFYLLTLRAMADGTFELIDPQKGGERVERFSSKQDAVDWLVEDEYQLVGGLAQPPNHSTRLDVMLGGGPAAIPYATEVANVKARIPEIADQPDVFVYLLWSEWGENHYAASFLGVDESSIESFRRWLLEEFPGDSKSPAVE